MFERHPVLMLMGIALFSLSLVAGTWYLANYTKSSSQSIGKLAVHAGDKPDAPPPAATPPKEMPHAEPPLPHADAQKAARELSKLAPSAHAADEKQSPPAQAAPGQQHEAPQAHQAEPAHSEPAHAEHGHPEPQAAVDDTGRDAIQSSEVRGTVEHALNAATPQQGIEQLQAMLGKGEVNTQDHARVLGAMAALEAQKQPPDIARIVACYREARGLDVPARMRERLTLKEVDLLSQHGAQQVALDQVNEAIEATPAEATPSLRLALVQAQLRVMLDASPQATQACAEVLDRTLENDARVDAETEQLVRMTALRLAKVYRDQGRTEDAETLARKLKRHFSTNGH